MSQKNSVSPWVWVGCGCILMVVVIVALIGGLGVAGYSLLSGMAEDMADPLARTEAAMQLLGADELPEGYQAIGFFKIPWFLDMVFLSDIEREPMKIEGDMQEKMEAFEDMAMDTRDIGDNTFFYIKLRSDGGTGDSIEDIMAGRGEGASQVDIGAELESFEELAAGQLMIRERAVTWQAHRGTLTDGSESVEGTYAVFAFDCADSTYSRNAFWFQRLDETEEPVDGAAAVEMTAEMTAESQQVESLQGTPADPAAMERLLSHFKVCG